MRRPESRTRMSGDYLYQPRLATPQPISRRGAARCALRRKNHHNRQIRLGGGPYSRLEQRLCKENTNLAVLAAALLTTRLSRKPSRSERRRYDFAQRDARLGVRGTTSDFDLS